MTRRLAPLASVVCALAAAPPAAAAELGRYYHGATAQGREVTVSGAPDGTPLSITVGYRVGCRRHDLRRSETLYASPPRYAVTRREFALVVADSLSGPPRADATIEIAVTGRRITPPRRPGAELWQGTLEVEVDVLDAEDGSLRERCRTRRMRWRAWREGYGTGGWTMTSDAGDYVGGGGLHSLRELAVFGDRQTVHAFAPAGEDGSAWRASFTAPPGERLRRGATFTDTGDDDAATDAGLDVSGLSRTCGDGGGTFTVRFVRYDRRGRLRDLDLEFTQWCGSSTGPALRGTITFRSRR